MCLAFLTQPHNIPMMALNMEAWERLILFKTYCCTHNPQTPKCEACQSWQQLPETISGSNDKHYAMCQKGFQFQCGKGHNSIELHSLCFCSHTLTPDILSPFTTLRFVCLVLFTAKGIALCWYFPSYWWGFKPRLPLPRNRIWHCVYFTTCIRYTLFLRLNVTICNKICYTKFWLESQNFDISPTKGQNQLE